MIGNASVQSAQGGAFAMMSEPNFPGLSDAQRSWIFDKTKDVPNTGKTKAQNDLYMKVLPIAIAKKKEKERIKAQQELAFYSQTEKNDEKKQQMKTMLKVSTFTDSIREDAKTKGYDVSEVGDDELLKSTINGLPDGKALMQDYINGGTKIFEVSGIGKQEVPMSEEDKERKDRREQFKIDHPKRAKLYQKSTDAKTLVGAGYDMVTGNTDDLSDEESLEIFKAEKSKSFGDHAKDFNNPAKVAVGATAAVAEGALNLADAGQEVFNKLDEKVFGLETTDYNLGDKVDEVAKDLGVDGGRYDAGKIATQLGMTAAAVTTLMGGLGTIGAVGDFVAKFPKITKYIAKPLTHALRGIEYRGGMDILEGETSTTKQYAWSAGLNMAFGIIGDKLSGWKEPSKKLKSAAVNVNKKYLESVKKASTTARDNYNAANPYDVVKKRFNDILKRVTDHKGKVGSSLDKVDDAMSKVKYNTDNIATEINKSLKELGIAPTIEKVKGVWKVVGKMTSNEGPKKLLTQIVDSMNGLKKLGTNGTLLGANTVNKLMKSLVKTDKGSVAAGALTKTSLNLTSQIDDVMANYKGFRADYANIKKLETRIKGIQGEGDKGTAILGKVFGSDPSKSTEAIEMLKLMRTLGYTADDMLAEVMSSTAIIKSVLGLDAWKVAVETAYPSVPGMIQLGMKAVSSIFGSEATKILRVAGENLKTPIQQNMGNSTEIIKAGVANRDKVWNTITNK